MEATSVNALIAAIAAVLGAAFAAIASGYSARSKLRHLALEYEQKLQDKYLENARQYLNNLYVPLSVELARLSRAFQVLQRHIDTKGESVSEEHAEVFREAANGYLGAVDQLSERGADAFLTVQLEEELRSFNDFLRASLGAEEVVVKLVFKVEFGVAGLRYGTEGHRLLVGRSVRLWGSNRLWVSILGNSLSYRANEVVAAPLGTAKFSKRFTSNVPALKTLIKEVTLGARRSE